MKRFLSLILAFCIACSLCFASVLSASASSIVGYGRDDLLKFCADFMYEKISEKTDNLSGEYLVYGVTASAGDGDNWININVTGMFFSSDIDFDIVEGADLVNLTVSSGGYYLEDMSYILRTDDVSLSYYQFSEISSLDYRTKASFSYDTANNALYQILGSNNNTWYAISWSLAPTSKTFVDAIVNVGDYQTNPEPTEPPTTKPVNEEQLEVSNSILDNIKTVVTNIINLPAKIAEAIGGFFTSLGETLLNGLEYLFVPSDNLFEDLINLLHEKFEFVFQIFEIGDFIIGYDFDDSPPDASVDFSGKKGLNWGSGKIQFINWEMIEPYRNLIKNLTLAIAWYFFIRKVQKRLPDIINGVSSGGND